MSYDFSYLIEKLARAEFAEHPFRHIYIEDFFCDEHIRELRSCNEIRLGNFGSDGELFEALYKAGYEIIDFPGCIIDADTYMKWHSGEAKAPTHSACEGFGITLRLTAAKSHILKEVKGFLESERFNRAITDKFGIDFEECNIDGGIQKYLDGYEISPHPDIRRKAATFMVNINPSDASDSSDHHTRYLKLKPGREYVRKFWEGNPTVDRCWVPWDWTEEAYQQTRNNSAVFFSPSDDTMHGVKARYDHLETQRTQLYGNLWYKKSNAESRLEWEDLDLPGIAVAALARSKSRRVIPYRLRKLASKIRSIGGSKNKYRVGKRNI